MAAAQLPLVVLFVLGCGLIKHSEGSDVCAAAVDGPRSRLHMPQTDAYYRVVSRLGVQVERCQTI